MPTLSFYRKPSFFVFLSIILIFYRKVLVFQHESDLWNSCSFSHCGVWVYWKTALAYIFISFATAVLHFLLSFHLIFVEKMQVLFFKMLKTLLNLRFFQRVDWPFEGFVWISWNDRGWHWMIILKFWVMLYWGWEWGGYIL